MGLFDDDDSGGLWSTNKRTKKKFKVRTPKQQCICKGECREDPDAKEFTCPNDAWKNGYCHQCYNGLKKRHSNKSVLDVVEPEPEPAPKEEEDTGLFSDSDDDESEESEDDNQEPSGLL